jgi:tRNA(Ile)-lysidine synthase
MKVSTPEGIIRPLLCVSREQILMYLNDQNLTFRVDSSNQDLFSQRNILRHQLFPLLRERFHPRVVQTLCRCAELARDEENYWDAQIQSNWPSLPGGKGRPPVPRCSPLTEPPAALQRRSSGLLWSGFAGICSAFMPCVEAFRRLILSDSSRRTVFAQPGSRHPSGMRWSLRGYLRQILWRKECRILRYPCFSLSLHLQEEERSARGAADLRALSTLPHQVWLDADRLQWPLIVRSWRPGDRFQPMGLGGSKKLQFYRCQNPKEQRCIRSWRSGEDLLGMGLRLGSRQITARTKQVLIAEMRVGG